MKIAVKSLNFIEIYDFSNIDYVQIFYQTLT